MGNMDASVREVNDMGVRPLMSALFFLILLAACTPDRPALNTGPVLLQENTLAPLTPSATRLLSPTPTPLFMPVSTWSDNASLSRTSTPSSGFARVTPTLPPSKTPTQTPPATRTPTATPSPSVTPNISLPPLLPTAPSGIVPIPTAIVSNPPVQACSVPWFFTNTQVVACPLNPPLVSPGSLQPFQGGYMIWVGQQDAIYALYVNSAAPRWQVFNDSYQDGMPEVDPNLATTLPGTWQPRRGFGLVWRGQPGVRDRLGWALSETEIGYTVQVQVGSDGSILMSDPNGQVFNLAPGGIDWKQF
jgi:hypothetical protein